MFVRNQQSACFTNWNADGRFQSDDACMKKTILLLCTANSCRSQIAHAYFEYLGGGRVDVRSAGVEANSVNPGAIATLKEDGIDISHYTANHTREYEHGTFDYVITVCDSALETCPYFPARIRNVHHDFPDPAKAIGTPEEIKQEFARVRDMIREYAANFLEHEGLLGTQKE